MVSSFSITREVAEEPDKTLRYWKVYSHPMQIIPMLAASLCLALVANICKSIHSSTPLKNEIPNSTSRYKYLNNKVAVAKKTWSNKQSLQHSKDWLRSINCNV